MQADICRHIKTSGAQCRAVALIGSAFCYYHRRLHTSHAPYRHNQVTRGYLLPGQHIELAPLEDRESVLLAASQVVNALATGNLDIKRATALFYGLQVAGAYAPHANPEAAPQSLTRTVHIAGDLSETPGVDLASPGYVHEIDADPDEDFEQDLDENQLALNPGEAQLQLPGASSQTALPSEVGEAPLQLPAIPLHAASEV
jgi:hypothetical protein